MEDNGCLKSMQTKQQSAEAKNGIQFDMVTELEKLVINYRNLQGLLDTFAVGVMAQLGDYDITRGVYAISEALEEQNRQLGLLLERIAGQDDL